MSPDARAGAQSPGQPHSLSLQACRRPTKELQSVIISLDSVPSLIEERVWASLKNGNSFSVTAIQTLTVS